MSFKNNLKNKTKFKPLAILAILILLFVSIVAISDVSAASTKYVNNTGVDNDDAGRGDSQATPYKSISYAVEKSSFSGIAKDNEVVIAGGNYSGNSNKRISISKNMSIYGAKYKNLDNEETIIDSNGDGRIFTIEGDVVVNIYGIKFMNTYTNDQGAIYNHGANLTIANCSFENCEVGPEGYGGAIYNYESNYFTLVNSTFKNCTGGVGGAVYVDGNYSLIDNCIFEKCKSIYPYNHVGGAAISINGQYNNITNSTFLNCSNINARGTVFCIGSYINFDNCKFINITGTGEGSVGIQISHGSNNINITNCDFTNLYSTSRGGAIEMDCFYLENGTMLYCFNILLNNSNFINCHAGLGGAIYADQSQHITILNSKFINCSSSLEGGAIRTFWVLQFAVSNSSFINCSASGMGGGAIMHDGDYANISSCVFINNSINDGDGAAIFFGVSSEGYYLSHVNYCIFSNNTGGLVIRTEGSSSNLTNNWWGTNNPHSLTNQQFENWYIMVLNTTDVNIPVGDVLRYNYGFYLMDESGVLSIDPDVNLLPLFNVTFIYNGEIVNITDARKIYEGANALSVIVNNHTNSIIASDSIFNILGINFTAKYKTNIVVLDTTAGYGGIVKLIVNVATNGNILDVVGKVVTFYFKGALIGNSTIDSEGVAVFQYNLPLSRGFYSWNTTFDEDDTCLSFNSVNATLTITQMVTNIVVSNVTATYSTPVDLIATLKNTDGNGISGQLVKFYINNVYVGNATTSTNSSGLAIFKYTPKSIGTFGISAVYPGDENFILSTESTMLVVKKINAVINTTSKLSATYRKTNDLKAILKDANGKVLAGYYVELVISGKKIANIKTNSEGIAIFKYKPSKPGKFTATFKYLGGTNHNAVTKSVSLNVAKAQSKIVVTKFVATYKKSGIFAAKLTDFVTKKVLSKQYLKFYIKGKYVGKAKTNKKGIATLKVSKVGTWGAVIATAKFAANKLNANAKVEKTVLIKR